MREIKFRAWDKKNKKMLIDFISIFNDTCEFDAHCDEEDLELMQYTGLKDKNGKGKEIYEGDLVKSDEWVFEVVWDEAGAWKYELRSNNWSPKMGVVLTIAEVIGNIYENPELLK